MLRIGSNILSLTVQRNLGRITTDLSTASERLASGQRINRASDDAAGLAISSSLEAKTRIFTQGVRNLNDGLSFLNVAQAATTELTGILTRIRELSTQASNGAFSNSQRQSIDKEAQALREEYNRIIATSELNGVNVLQTTQLALKGGIGQDGVLQLGLSASRTVTAGDGTFQAQQTLATGTGPYSVVAADLDNDGIGDLVSANTSGDSISILLGNGNGTFQTQQTMTAGNGAIFAEVADLNGDGVLDVITANSSSADISVFIGNGDGTFQAQQSIAAQAGPYGVEAADFNGDGNLDLVTANYSNNSLSVLLGNGNGTFQAQQTLAVGANPTSVKAGDVNGDGELDLIATNYIDNNVSTT